MLPISTDITSSVIDRHEKDGLACPSKLRNGVFTTAAVDNIDHNPSSTSSQNSFHGTAISLSQHQTTKKSGTERITDVSDASRCVSSKIINGFSKAVAGKDNFWKRQFLEKTIFGKDR